MIVPDVPAFSRRYIAAAASLVLSKSMSPDEAISKSVTSKSAVPFTSRIPGKVTEDDATVAWGVMVSCATDDPEAKLSKVNTPPSAACTVQISILLSPLSAMKYSGAATVSAPLIFKYEVSTPLTAISSAQFLYLTDVPEVILMS